ncbi:hypothetical protein KUTeg_024282 [Tegillarca granosa]|uniref:Heat shock 70 kDa protein 12A n=1 Tax=Tegillarca granosa TaxID=220873 RepID=A0ABQ9DZY2_TEGGR|nr:hypothetical protein KUTeg_024282 [Tegillarca granosa]
MLGRDENSSSLGLVTVAIDFGTTYSGYAFAFRHQPERIILPIWSTSGCKGLASKKTPCDILLNRDGKFVAFGYAAREKYCDLRDDDDHQGYYYFRKFKMELHKRKSGLSYRTQLKDVNGKTLPAIKVFSMSIQYLKDKVLEHVKKTGPLVTENDLNWVLTVPAIWDEQAKYFMRKAAEEAGIPGKQLILALEPEAASVYAKEINVRRSEGGLSPYEPGTKFMVLDLGAKDLKDVIIVGGFADSFIIRKMIKEKFPDLTFVIPDEAELVVLKGAVLYGNNPNIVSERINKFTYGTEIHRFFLDGDDENKKIRIGGTSYCRSVFNKLAEIGQPFKIGEVVQTEIYPLKADMTKMSVKFYQSSERDPKYVDSDKCTFLGKIVVDMPDINGGLDRCVNVFVGFGDTELKITGQDECSGSNVHAELKLLD